MTWRTLLRGIETSAFVESSRQERPRSARNVRDGLEAGEAIGAGAAREAEDERLGHVVGMVSGGDGVEAQKGGHAGEEGEADAPGRHFDRLAAPPPYARTQGVEWEPVPCGEGFDEAGVFR